ncbi:TonB-dependent receptor [Sphingomonas sp.]|uniref:TonB-dependent receptor n=1 Tax=Sphingomonas sp. TaxID=28214 RepID=UPI003D6CFF7D
MKHSLLLSSSLLGIAITGPAYAQAADPAAPPATTEQLATETQAANDGDIIVTATRRNERLRDVPLSITAFSQSKLSAEGIVGYEGLARETPGIVINKPTANFNNFTARGIATNGYGAGLSSTVAIYLDELPISTTGNSTVIDPNLYDVERVEFLRGPQGTLFGAGSLSGALRILTKSPDLNKFDVSGSADIGLTGSDSVRQRYNAMVNVPLIDDVLGLRVVGFYRHEDGWVDNLDTGVHNANTLKDYGGRAILLFKPTDRLSARFLASYENSRPEDSALITPRFGRDKHRSFRPDVYAGKLQNYNATIDYQFDGARLTSSSTYSHYYQDFIVDISGAVGRLFPYGIEATGPQKTFVQETRLASDPGGKLDWVIGGFYLNRTLDVTQIFRTTSAFLASRPLTGALGPNGDIVQALIYRQKSHELAGFGEVTYRFTDRFWATGGIRYGRTDSQIIYQPGNFTSNFLGAALTPNAKGALSGTTPTTTTSTQAKVTGSRPSFKGSLSFRASDDVTTYASVSTGYRAPVRNANAGRISAIDKNDLTIPAGAGSDKLINYELGLKGRFFGGKLMANVALYYIDWKDIQVQANRVSDSVQFATNIGGARSRGLEFEIVANPVNHLSFGANGSIGGTKITKLSASEAAISGAVLGGRLSAANFQGSMFAQIGFDLSAATSGYFNATFQHVGSFPNNFPNVPGKPGVIAPTFGYTDSYENINFSLALKRDKLSATLYLENVLDDHSITYIHPEGFVDSRFGTLRPRTVGIRLGYNL